jgi:hypothetical protein
LLSNAFVSNSVELCVTLAGAGGAVSGAGAAGASVSTTGDSCRCSTTTASSTADVTTFSVSRPAVEVDAALSKTRPPSFLANGSSSSSKIPPRAANAGSTPFVIVAAVATPPRRVDKSAARRVVGSRIDDVDVEGCCIIFCIVIASSASRSSVLTGSIAACGRRDTPRRVDVTLVDAVAGFETHVGVEIIVID